VKIKEKDSVKYLNQPYFGQVNSNSIRNVPIQRIKPRFCGNSVPSGHYFDGTTKIGGRLIRIVSETSTIQRIKPRFRGNSVPSGHYFDEH
jgi:hypothetical protein